MFKYEPTVKDMTDAFTVAYGDTGVDALVGAMFANLSPETIERLYAQALQATREDLAKKGLL
jgi:hypothetical protein